MVAVGALPVANRELSVGARWGAGEALGRVVAVGFTISIAGVLDAAIVGPDAGCTPQPPISPAMKISQSEVFMSSSLVVEPSNL
jgi:hypothetical protein